MSDRLQVTGTGDLDGIYTINGNVYGKPRWSGPYADIVNPFGAYWVIWDRRLETPNALDANKQPLPAYQYGGPDTYWQLQGGYGAVNPWDNVPWTRGSYIPPIPVTVIELPDIATACGIECGSGYKANYTTCICDPIPQSQSPGQPIMYGGSPIIVPEPVTVSEPAPTSTPVTATIDSAGNAVVSHNPLTTLFNDIKSHLTTGSGTGASGTGSNKVLIIGGIAVTLYFLSKKK